MKKHVPRKTILKSIRENLDLVYQWGRQIAEKQMNADFTGNAIEYLYRAEALIELLETVDCGSVGGFDVSRDGHGSPRGFYSLEERYEALVKKGTKRPC